MCVKGYVCACVWFIYFLFFSMITYNCFCVLAVSIHNCTCLHRNHCICSMSVLWIVICLAKRMILLVFASKSCVCKRPKIVCTGAKRDPTTVYVRMGSERKWLLWSYSLLCDTSLGDVVLVASLVCRDIAWVMKWLPVLHIVEWTKTYMLDSEQICLLC